MLKKAKAEEAGKETGGHKDKDAAQAVLDSSRQIWLAGLGAFSRAQAEGMKVFETLVKQGEVLESKTRRAAVDRATMAQSAAKAKVKEMQKGVGGTWDKLEQVFEHRVERALAKLGVYTQTDMERLTQRVDKLSDAVNELIRLTGVKPKPRPAPAKKSAKHRAKAPASAGATAAAEPAAQAAGETRKTVRKVAKRARSPRK
jgi:poly(hydroxyalkanoate) granule-associated protein